MGVIYIISFVGARRVYVGSAKDLRVRLRAHLHLLREGRHHSIILQRAAEKYGLSNIVVAVLETVPDHLRLIEREQHWIDHFSGRLYNRSPTAGSRLGATMSPEACAKISASLVGNKYRLGIPFSAEERRRIGDAVKRGYADGTRTPNLNPQNLRAFNDAIKNGTRLHPSRKPARDAAIVASHARTRSLKQTGAEFDITAAAVWCVVKRCSPHQLRQWRRKSNGQDAARR